MQLSLVGLSHHTAPIEVRERLHFPEKDLPAALHALVERDAVEEAIILSTCNRVEILARLADDADARSLLGDFLSRQRRVPRDLLDKHLYHHSQREAVRHIFRVAASLDSMIVGEPQVLGQVKAAYATGRAVGTVGGILDAVLAHAFATAKKVRTETGVAASAVSVSYAAVELARKIFGSLEGKTVFLIGAGKMSELAARHLRRSGARAIFVANRTLARAEELAKELGGETVRFDELLNFISRADIVISSTGAPVYIIKKEHGARFLAERRNRPMFFIDIAVPRDIDPALNKLNNIFLYDIDDLQQVVEANLRQRRREALRAEEIVEREVDRLLGRLKRLEVAPTIAALQEHLHGIRQQELERARLRDLSPEQHTAVEEMTRRLVNKILHGPIAELKRLPQEPNGLKLTEFARRLFRLKE
ncbi:MAG: glutamyl-tRNA reductase [Acidobacteria bacterium]|nr:glutamyl-tRNA reductase [Acidobacteriota bacterium]MCH8946016.1 glutamyl-tRNA reductase [Acidobacteriota bacterium]